MLSSVLLDNSRLEATIDRRTFIRLVAGSAACSFVGGAVPAGAEELDDNFTPFSPELAAEMASAFFEGAVLREPVVYPHVSVPSLSRYSILRDNCKAMKSLRPTIRIVH